MKSLSLSPEKSILLLIARLELNPTQISALQQLLATANWTELLRLAEMHNLSLLLHRNLVTHCSDSVPAEVTFKLQRLKQKAQIRRSFLQNILFELLEVFQAKGITALPYKGPVLESLAYGETGLRVFGDLDVFVRTEDLAAARALLVEQGFYCKDPVPASREAFYHQHHFHHQYVRPADGLMVELHWGVTMDWLGVNFKALNPWERLETVTINERSVLVPCAEDWVFLLCVNATKDLWGRLELVASLTEIIRRNPEMDWSALLDRVNQLERKRVLLIGLALANQLLSTPLPDFVLAEIKADSSIPKLLRCVFKKLWRGPDAGLSTFNHDRFHLTLLEKWSAKRHFLFEYYCQSKNYLMYKELSTYWQPFYPLLHLLIMISSYTRIHISFYLRKAFGMQREGSFKTAVSAKLFSWKTLQPLSKHST